MDIFNDKKFVIVSLLSIALVFVVFLVAGYSHLPLYDADVEDKLGCLIMLPEKHCSSGTSINYLGHQAVGFNIPEGTEIYAPYNGAFFEDAYADEANEIPLATFIRARFGIPETPSFAVFTAIHSPMITSGEGVTAGETVALMGSSTEPIHEESNSNFVVYGDNYYLASLFK